LVNDEEVDPNIVIYRKHEAVHKAILPKTDNKAEERKKKLYSGSKPSISIELSSEKKEIKYILPKHIVANECFLVTTDDTGV